MRLFFLSLMCAVAGAASASAPPGSVDDFIATELPRSGAPGLVYAIVEDGDIQAAARGAILTVSGAAGTADTPFLLGSISKSFTALAVMQLVEGGEVALDAGIATYLPVFADRPSGATTVRQLLSHTSGFSTRQGNDTHTDLTDGEGELSRQVDRIAQWRPAREPGVAWEYSNANYQVLGALIETVSGRDFASYLEAEILAPIGMVDSFVADGARHETMALAHRPWFGAKRAMDDGVTHRVIAPAGGVIASAPDVARYLAVMMNGEDDVVSAESKAAMMRPASAVAPFYGFGWFIDAETQAVFHTGVSPGMDTLAILLPAEQRGAVVLVNAGGGFGFGETSDLLSGTAARALGLDPAENGPEWSRKGLFVMFALLPIFFGLSLIWASLHREGLRAKSGLAGRFSLWFPLVATLALALVVVDLIPRLFGVSIITLQRFQPDLVLVMLVAAVTGVLLASTRIAIAYSGDASPRQS